MFSLLVAGLVLLWSVSLSAEAGGPVKVEIRGEPGAYRLHRGGKAYRIRGAGTQVAADLASVRAQGGNSVRTWAPDGALLDKAEALGLTVAMGLNMAHERHGFDYGNAEAVRRQHDRIRQEVLRYREHPALLVWIIGNELNLNYTDRRVYDAVNDIARMIHELDPNHPATTTTAGFSATMAAELDARAPDLDFISVQFYGGLFGLEEILDEAAYQRPIMVTEWGTVGHWEVPVTAWGAPIEPDSSKKADLFLRGHSRVLAPMAGRIIGDYVFLWGHKQERTPTWYGVFTPDGGRTAAVDVMHRIWTGGWPPNRAPAMNALYLDGRTAAAGVTLEAGRVYGARAGATDGEGEGLSYRWRLLRESEAKQIGGDAEEVPEDLSHLIGDAGKPSVSVTAPKSPGAYRLFVYVRDGHGGVAHANLPFYVTAAGET